MDTNVIIRLYRRFDLDLLYLYSMPGVSLSRIMREAIRAFVAQEEKTIKITTCDDIPVTIPLSAQFHINLSETEDADVIAWLKSVRGGYRNGFLKNITRHYISRNLAAPYFYDKHIIFGDEASKGESKQKRKRDSKKISKTTAVKDNKQEKITVTADTIIHAPAPTTNTEHEYTEADSVLKEKVKDDDDAMDIFDSMLNSFE